MPGGFLAAVLQRVEAVVGELGDIFARGPDAEDAAFLARFVLVVELLASHDRAAPGAGGLVT